MITETTEKHPFEQAAEALENEGNLRKNKKYKHAYMLMAEQLRKQASVIRVYAPKS